SPLHRTGILSRSALDYLPTGNSRRYHSHWQHPDRIDKKHDGRCCRIGDRSLRSYENYDRIQSELYDRHISHHCYWVQPDRDTGWALDVLVVRLIGGNTVSKQYVLFDAPGPRAKRITRMLYVLVALFIITIFVWIYQVLAEHGQMKPSLWWNAINFNAWSNYLLPGVQFTLQAAAIAVVTSVVFGLGFGFLRLAPFRVIRWVA